MNQESTVYVVDDDPAVLRSLELLLRSVGIPVRTFSGGQAFLDGFDAAGGGCLVLDVRMPGMSGLELQRRLKERDADFPVIIITGHGDVPIAVRTLKEGAIEFLEKPFSKQLLLEHIRDALARDRVRRVESAARRTEAARLARLSERERRVMELVVAGLASKQIALELGISKKTVDAHRARVMRKLEVDSVPQLVATALRSGALPPASDAADRTHGPIRDLPGVPAPV